jgi:hypothetical protein
MRFLKDFLDENTTPKGPSKPSKPSSVGFEGPGTLVYRPKNSSGISPRTPTQGAAKRDVRTLTAATAAPHPGISEKIETESKPGIGVADVTLHGPTAEDWAAIEEEAARWHRDADGVYHQVQRERPERVCIECDRDGVPSWRRGGKIIEIKADGTPALMCHFCGRRVGTA